MRLSDSAGATRLDPPQKPVVDYPARRLPSARTSRARERNAREAAGRPPFGAVVRARAWSARRLVRGRQPASGWSRSRMPAAAPSATGPDLRTGDRNRGCRCRPGQFRGGAATGSQLAGACGRSLVGPPKARVSAVQGCPDSQPRRSAHLRTVRAMGPRSYG